MVIMDVLTIRNEKSALSMHTKDVHELNASLNNFQISVIEKVSPQQIRREEFRYIEKYRTKQSGLNRYKATSFGFFVEFGIVLLVLYSLIISSTFPFFLIYYFR